MSKRINIRPSTGVYATYKHIKYDPWTAIAEFVDNSTQSYYDNEEKLKAIKYWDKLNVEIIYDRNSTNGERLVIQDNAFGMNFKDFQRAIVLDSPPQKATRSEFGMGLKTAACWFGTKWTVESTELGSGLLYKATIDVDSLQKYKNEEIEVEETTCSNKMHGTTITIENLNRKISGRQIGKTKAQLSGMYRSDIRKKEISIQYNGEALEFNDPSVLVEKLPNGVEKEWKKQIEFTVPYQGEELKVSGFVAIREKASTAEAGFSLLRRGRVIVGGYENAYRPKEIFEQSNSFIYQRLFGELNMDNWPVTQTKDAFDWYNGLEDDLIDRLKEICADYCEKAKTYRVGKRTSFEDNTPKVADAFQNAGIITEVKVKNIPDTDANSDADAGKGKEDNQDKEHTDDDSDNIIVEGSVTQEITFKRENEKYTFILNIEKDDPGQKWLSIRKKEDDIIEIKWNMRHPFFKPYIDDPAFIQVMEKFIFAMAITELDLNNISENNLVEVSSFRVKMNEILKELHEDATKDTD